MKYSAVIITRNEQAHIAHTIENVGQVADEVVVVDDFSADDTPDIAEQKGAVVFQRELSDNWAQQRNFGLEYVSNDWALTLDADERLSEEAVVSLANFGPSDLVRAVKILRTNYYKDRPLQHGRFKGDFQHRAVRSDVRYRLDLPVHELPDVEPEETVVLNGHIDHFTYDGLKDLFTKTKHHSRVHGESGQPMFDRPFLVQAVRNIGRIPLQGVYRDGWPGIVNVAAEIYGNYIKYDARRKLTASEQAVLLETSIAK